MVDRITCRRTAREATITHLESPQSKRESAVAPKFIAFLRTAILIAWLVLTSFNAKLFWIICPLWITTLHIVVLLIIFFESIVDLQ